MTSRIALIGRSEPRLGSPFIGQAGRILDACLAEAGLRREDVATLLADDVAATQQQLARMRPRVIVALGAEAAHAVVPEWPDARDGAGDLWHRGTIRSACDIEQRRGYVFDALVAPVVVATHPATCIKTWTPWRVLLSYDLQRAQEIARNGLVRPTRDVQIIGSDSDARRALVALRRFKLASCDIETRGDTSLACIGFAGEGGASYVFPAQYLSRAAELLGDPKLTLVFANGIYDLFVLKHRCGVVVRARVEDVQLQWHAAYPELAGAREDKKRMRRFTRKSLSFLASLFTHDRWWKGDYETEEEFFEYNGKDCGITRDIWDKTSAEVAKMGAQATYEHERRLMWPCVDMLQRGLRVDDALRRSRIGALETAIKETTAAANLEVLPLLERERERLGALGALRLFEETDPTCECCGHGAKKQAACWGCADFGKAPTKREMYDRWFAPYSHLGDTPAFKDISKERLEALLPVCRVCEGRPRETRLVANLNSDAQVKVLLYDVLGAPKRFKRNTKGESVVTVDESALRSLLGAI